MSGESLIVTTLTVIAALAILLYWWVAGRNNAAKPQQRPSATTFALVVLGFAACGWSVSLDRAAVSYSPQSSPMAIAVAFDLSPSMLAIPDPLFDREVPPRHMRAKMAVLDLFRALEERQENIVVSLIGFTRNAEVLMGWDNDAAQIRDILEHGLSPDLFTNSGTSIEAAVEKLIDVFGMLPQGLQRNSRQIAILVSDGEDTLPNSFLGYALEDLAASSFDVIALQSGLLDTSEGVPRYGQVGEFLGFEAMGGDLYTVPNVQVMQVISSATPGRGLHVRAEDPKVVEKMLRFLGELHAADGNTSRTLVATLGLFTVVGLLCIRVLQ